MPLKIARGAKAALAKATDRAVVQVTGVPAESARRALRDALARFSSESVGRNEDDWRELRIEAVELPDLPLGPAVLIELADGIAREPLLRLLDLVVEQLEDCDVRDGVVRVPSDPRLFDRIHNLQHFPVLHMFLDRAPPSSAQLDLCGSEARSWLSCGDLATDSWAAIESVWFAATQDSLAPILRSTASTANGLRAVAFTPDLQQLRGSWVAAPPPGLRMSLTAGGPTTSTHTIERIVDDLVEVARRIAHALTYAFVALEPVLERFLLSSPALRPGDVPGFWTFEQLCDELVFDAFCYQVLSPGHVHRLGNAPHGSKSLPNDRVELSLDPRRWIADQESWEPEADAFADEFVVSNQRARGRRLLAPCIVSDAQALDIAATRALS